MNDTTTIDLTHFDVRRIPCRIKHAQIFQRWTDLPVGGYFVLVNDHDPVPLYYQFRGLFPGAFTWEYLVDGPDEFQVKITRLKETLCAPTPPPPRRPAAAHPEAVSELDLRGMVPPEPMLRALETFESLAAGATFRVRTERRPLHLCTELTTRGAKHASELAADGSWVTTITRG